MKKRIALLLAVTMLTGITACGSQKTEEAPAAPVQEQGEQEEAPEDSGKPISLAFNDRNRTEPFHISLYEGLKAATEEKGWGYQEAINDGDTMKHLQGNESFITKEVDIIVDFTCLPETGEVCADAAAKAGIPFITVDVDYGENAYFFGVDGYDAGTKLGQGSVPILKERFGQVDWIVLLSAVSTSPTVQLRLDGVVDAVEAEFGEVAEDHYVILDCGTDDVKTATYTRDFLNAHPEDSNILFIGVSDDRGYACNGQVVALGRTEDCAVVSFNGDPASREDLRAQKDEGAESAWIASIAFNPHKYGEQIIAYAEEILAGNAEKTKNCITTVLTTENVHDYLKEIGEE